MTYAERLAEFVKITGSKPGEMNKQHAPDRYRSPADVRNDRLGSTPAGAPSVSLEPARQSAGPGRCNRFTRIECNEQGQYARPCKLPANHEGPHSP